MKASETRSRELGRWLTLHGLHDCICTWLPCRLPAGGGPDLRYPRQQEASTMTELRMYCSHCGASVEKDSEGVLAHRAPVCGPFMSEGGIRYDSGQAAAIRLCAWCEKMHPEHVSIEWTHGDQLYFCTDTCHSEWAEHG